VNDCVFCRIAAGSIPADIVERNDEAIVVRDLNPQAPTHLVVIPTRHFAHLGEFVEQASSDEVGRLFALASRVGKRAGSEGYRVVVNEGEHGGQTVFHLHLHVLAGRRLQWPPG